MFVTQVSSTICLMTGVDVRNQRYEYPKMSDALHAWNTFSRFYIRYSSCVSLIAVS